MCVLFSDKVYWRWRAHIIKYMKKFLARRHLYAEIHKQQYADNLLTNLVYSGSMAALRLVRVKVGKEMVQGL